MFGYLGSGGEVRNLGIEGGSVTGNQHVGSLVARNEGGTIRACYATGNVTGSSSSVGGLVGINNSGSISACYATGNVTGGNGAVGGLVGSHSGSIRASYATGNVTGENGNVGGLVGINSGIITACYSTGVARSPGYNSNVGGLVGYNNSGSISACYATGTAEATDPNGEAGGLVGLGLGTSSINNSYFDTDLSTATQGVGTGTIITGLDKTTAELITPTAYGTSTDIYAAWNVDVDDADNDNDLASGVDDPWDFGTDMEYPALKVDFDGIGEATAYEFGVQGRNPPTVPAQIIGLSAMAGNMQVTLSWTVPENGGDLITAYEIKQAVSSGDLVDAEPTIVAVNSINILNSDASYIVGSLTNGTTYYFQVAATNSAGTGSYSTEASAVPAATLTVDLTLLTFVSGGETQVLSIMSNTSWTAESDAVWLTLSPLSGTGSGSESINVEASANPTTSARTATITITDDGGSLTETVNVSQAAGAATLTVSPASLTFAPGGETLPLSITSNTNWTATTSESWLMLSVSSGSGSESIDVEAVANPTTSARTATITITDGGSLTEMVSVSQDDPSATLAVLPTSLTFVSGGETQALSITSNTSWMASSDVNWLTLSTSSDTGNGMIDVVAVANTTTSARTATITITYGTSSTRMVSVSQAAMPMISFASASGTATDDATSTSAPLEVSLEVSNGGFVSDTNITITVAATTGTIADGDYTLAVKSGSVATLTSANPYTLSVPANETSITLEFTSEDADNEGEVATLTLSSSTATNIGTEDVHTITITDNDEPAGASTDVFNVPSADGVLRVYPHPASDVVSMKGLSSTRRYVYSLYSLTGVEVLSGLLEADTIDISTLAEGQYVLVLRSEKEEFLRTRLLVLK